MWYNKTIEVFIMSREKTFKTLDEQLEILRSKGLCIDDESFARNILLKENYFFISGYRHLFIDELNDKKFISGTKFSELYSVFVFDRHVRNIMFKYLLIIENNIKSIISYQLSKNYGYKEKDYLNAKNFTQDSLKVRQVNDVLSKMKRQIRANAGKHGATLHYINNYGYIPMWILVKVLSFGIISEFYCILKPDDQLAIADLYNLKTDTLGIYLSILSNFRNLCAHEDILYDHRTQKCIPNDKIHSILNIDKDDDEYIYGKNDLFAVIIIMKYMLFDSEFNDLINEIGYEINILDEKVDTVSLNSILNRLGFPNNWKDIKNIG